mgnify:CR=1 FL=1
MLMFNKETLLNLGEYSKKATPIAPPIYQSSSFVGGGEYSYTRLSNPTRTHLEETVSSLEGAADSVAFTSGMAAITAVFEFFAPGDKILCSADLYGGTVLLLDSIGKNGGPRCCKRNGRIAVLEAIDFIREKFGVELEKSEDVACAWIGQNNQCIMERCPFYR